MQEDLKKILLGIKSYFNVADDLVPQTEAEMNIRSGVSFKGSQLLMLIFAIFIASLGLNTNSVPVVIGAMLISPLMGPIMGIGLGIGIQDYNLIKRGLKNIGMAVLMSVVASAIYFLISPQYEGSSQLLARTSPSIYDVFVALFGGAAGILSIGCKNKGQVLPGVAIATSLMPPLCTAGYGLATMQGKFFFGAMYLFFTNMIFIMFATWIGVRMMNYEKMVLQDTSRNKRIQKIVYTVVALTVIVSCILTYQMFRDSIFENKAELFIEKDLVFPNTQVLSYNEYVKDGKQHIDVTLIGEELSKDSLELALRHKLDSLGLGGAVLNIKQGFTMSSASKDSLRNFDKFYNLMQQELTARQQTIDSLQKAVKEQHIYSDESLKVAPEVKVLFPMVTDLTLSRMVTASTDVPMKTDTVNMLIVNAPSGMTPAEKKRLVEFMEVRFKAKDVHITLNPSGFPWPSEK